MLRRQHKNCPVLAMKYPFLIHNRAVSRTAAGTYVMGAFSSKNERQKISHVHSRRNTGSVNTCISLSITIAENKRVKVN